MLVLQFDWLQCINSIQKKLTLAHYRMSGRCLMGGFGARLMDVALRARNRDEWKGRLWHLSFVVNFQIPGNLATGGRP